MMSDMIISGSFACMIFFLPAESYLMYVNYLARVKYKEHFKETTKLWLKFDRKGLTVLTLALHFAIMTGVMLVLASYSELLFVAGLVCGLIWLNALVDDKTLKRKLACVETKCTNLDTLRKCLNCAIPDEYNISLFPRIKIRKKKTADKQSSASE